MYHQLKIENPFSIRVSWIEKGRPPYLPRYRQLCELTVHRWTDCRISGKLEAPYHVHVLLAKARCPWLYQTKEESNDNSVTSHSMLKSSSFFLLPAEEDISLSLSLIFLNYLGILEIKRNKTEEF